MLNRQESEIALLHNHLILQRLEEKKNALYAR